LQDLTPKAPQDLTPKAPQCLGGVYLAGGIAPRILPILQQGAFLEGFRDKGRFSAWMERVPVYVVLDEDVGLKGAALAATV